MKLLTDQDESFTATSNQFVFPAAKWLTRFRSAMNMPLKRPIDKETFQAKLRAFLNDQLSQADISRWLISQVPWDYEPEAGDETELYAQAYYEFLVHGCPEADREFLEYLLQCMEGRTAYSKEFLQRKHSQVGAREIARKLLLTVGNFLKGSLTDAQLYAKLFDVFPKGRTSCVAFQDPVLVELYEAISSLKAELPRELLKDSLKPYERTALILEYAEKSQSDPGAVERLTRLYSKLRVKVL